MTGKTIMIEKVPRIVVIGVGNLLMKDEGAGIHAIRELEQLNLSSDVVLVDGGTSPDLIACTRAGAKMIIIDAAKAGGEPGAIYRFHPEDLAAEKTELASAHQMGVVENLAMMELAGNKPAEVIIIGIEPAEIDWGMELSPTLQSRMPILIEVLLKEIRGEYHQKENPKPHPLSF
jgi:hydrogenase maturation protease